MKSAARNRNPPAAFPTTPADEVPVVPSVNVASVAAPATIAHAKSGDRLDQLDAQQRAREQAGRVPVGLADTRVAEDEMQRAGDPAIERLVVEGPFAALQPEAVHEDAVAGGLIGEPVVDRVHREMSDLRRERGEERQPRDAEQHERPLESARRSGDGYPCRAQESEPASRRTDRIQRNDRGEAAATLQPITRASNPPSADTDQPPTSRNTSTAVTVAATGHSSRSNRGAAQS